MDFETIVAKIVTDYVLPPDYTNLMRDINDNHSEDFVKLKSDGICPATGNPWLPTYYKVLFTTSDTIIVQQIQMSYDLTRFRVRKFHASEWSDYFVSWLSHGDEAYNDYKELWDLGAAFYGADVG